MTPLPLWVADLTSAEQEASRDFLELATGTFTLKLVCACQVSKTGLFVGAVWCESGYFEHFFCLGVSWITFWLCHLTSLPEFCILVESSWGAWLSFLQDYPGHPYTLASFTWYLKIVGMSELCCLKLIRPNSFECTLHPRACHPTLKSISVGHLVPFAYFRLSTQCF